jgi:opacity protein-like surface antigen
MMKKFFFLLAVFAIISNVAVYAQDTDSTDNDECNGHNWHSWHNWNNWDPNWNFFDGQGEPFIEVHYGFSTSQQNNIFSKFAKVGFGEIKLGYSKVDSVYDPNIVELKDKYLFASRISSYLKSGSPNFDEMKSDMWRFGIAWRSGYGYRFGAVTITPYHSGGFAWSRIEMKTSPSDFWQLTNPPMPYDKAVNDINILNRYQDAFRFGTVWEGGISLTVSNTISINTGYEAAVIFPRYMFWKHAGSFIIEEGGLGLLDEFIDKIADKSPIAAPIVNFLLKNGFSYAFYTLKKDKMNWPFETETPMTYETFKIGLTFTF